MPAVNIFLANRRFASRDEMKKFVSSENGSQAQFLQEIGLRDANLSNIQLIFKPNAESIYKLLEGAPDFDRWGKKVRYVAGVYDSAILVYEPNLMRTPEATTLYYMGRLVYEHIK